MQNVPIWKSFVRDYSWINIHIYAISYLIQGDLFLFVWLICGEIQEKCQRFRTTLCFVDLVKNAARPGGQDLNLCLFLVKSDFLVGGSGVPWHFLCRGILFIWPKDSAESHQPTATTHIGLHCKGAFRNETSCFFQAWMWHFILINLLFFKRLILD